MGASFVEGQVRRLFEWYGPVVLKYRWPLFIFPIVVSLGLSAGFIRMAELRVDDPSYVFTPKDSRYTFTSSTLTYLCNIQYTDINHIVVHTYTHYFMIYVLKNLFRIHN